MNDGYQLKVTEGKGEGVVATKVFAPNEIVMKGIIKEVLSQNDSHASQISKNKHVRHAGLVPKVNHSCDPNCGIKINETGAHDFVARQDIKVGDELTFDYAMRNYSINYFLMSCECGSQHCRQKITGYKDLPESRKEAYSGFIAPYLLEIDNEVISSQNALT